MERSTTALVRCLAGWLVGVIGGVAVMVVGTGRWAVITGGGVGGVEVETTTTTAVVGPSSPAWWHTCAPTDTEL